MTGELYIESLGRFIADHQIPRDLASRIRKLNEETGELSEAIINGNLADIQAEACDAVNVAFDILRCIAGDPWEALLLNLREKDLKYSEGRQRTEPRK